MTPVARAGMLTQSDHVWVTNGSSPWFASIINKHPLPLRSPQSTFDTTLLLSPSLRPRSKWKNNTRLRRANRLAIQVLESRPIRPRRVLLLAKNLRPTRQRIVAPSPVEIQPVERIVGVIRLEGVSSRIIAIGVCAQDRIPQCPSIRVINNQPGGEVEVGDGMVVVTDRFSLCYPKQKTNIPSYRINRVCPIRRIRIRSPALLL